MSQVSLLLSAFAMQEQSYKLLDFKCPSCKSCVSVLTTDQSVQLTEKQLIKLVLSGHLEDDSMSLSQDEDDITETCEPEDSLA